MRYRLRTLLTGITVACLYLGWVAHVRKKADFHRDPAARIAQRIAVLESDTQKEVEFGIQSLAAGRSATMTRRLANGTIRITTIKNGPTARVIADESEVEWHDAIEHTMKANAFDRAALRPWELIRQKNP